MQNSYAAASANTVQLCAQEGKHSLCGQIQYSYVENLVKECYVNTRINNTL